MLRHRSVGVFIRTSFSYCKTQKLINFATFFSGTLKQFREIGNGESDSGISRKIREGWPAWRHVDDMTIGLVVVNQNGKNKVNVDFLLFISQISLFSKM